MKEALKLLARKHKEVSKAIKDKDWVRLHELTKEFERLTFRVYLMSDNPDFSET